MTEYDRMVQATQIAEEELRVLVSCLVRVANADGIYSPEERAAISGIVESFTNDPELAHAFLDDPVALPDSITTSCPEIVILLSYMIAYTDGCFSESEAREIESLAKRLGIPDERHSKLHVVVKKKLYNMVFFNKYEDLQKSVDERVLLDDLKTMLNLNEEDANEEERRVRTELGEVTNA